MPNAKLPLIVQDMPSMFYQSGAQDLSQEDKKQYKAELQSIMQQHYNFPWYDPPSGEL